MNKHTSAAAVLVAVASIGTSFAQGLFAKAGEQANNAVAAYEEIWDSFYGKFDELLVAEADKEAGSMEFDQDKGIAHFTVQLTVNETNYEAWKAKSHALLEAAGVKTEESRSYRKIGGKQFCFGANADGEIERAFQAGDLEMPRTGVIVELVDEKGAILQYAALPIGVFKCQDKDGRSVSVKFPLYNLARGKEEDFMTAKHDDTARVSLSFAGMTKNSLLAVADIKCRVLVDPVFTEEARRLALEKIKADDKVFAEHGIATKTILLPGGVPLAVNQTPRGSWFCRYELTQDQWQAVTGKNPSIDYRKSEKIRLNYKPDTTEKFIKWNNPSEWGGFAQLDSPDMPVDCFGWLDAVAFVEKLNSLPEVKEAGLEFSIPKGLYTHSSHYDDAGSEWNHGTPDWDYACLGASAYGIGPMFDAKNNFGLDLDGNKMGPEETSWCEAEAIMSRMKFGDWDQKMHPVGMKRPNAFGLYDMIGNAGEIVDEQYNLDRNGRPKKAQFGGNTRKVGFKECDEIWINKGATISSEKCGLRLEATAKTAD